MRIVYDFQALRMQKFGGISRYHYEIFKYLKKDKSLKVKLPIICAENFYFRNAIFYVKRIPFGNYFLNLQIMKLFMKVFGNSIDILHPTYYDVNYLTDQQLLDKKYKLIITVHDMIHEKFIQEDKETISAKRRVVENADGIIAISECTKKDLLYYFPDIDADKIRVIYHGCSMQQCSEVSTKIVLPEKYILYVGERGGYKNCITLLNAFPKVLKKHKDVKLVCVGGGAFTKGEQEIIEGLGLTNYVQQYSMTDEELSMAYGNAQAFIFPSKYEGFGIPILEAFKCKCPVILANASCFPEIAEDAAIYFGQDDSDELADKMIELLDNPALREKLIRKGVARVQSFSWEKAAEETLEFYKYVLR